MCGDLMYFYKQTLRQAKSYLRIQRQNEPRAPTRGLLKPHRIHPTAGRRNTSGARVKLAKYSSVLYDSLARTSVISSSLFYQTPRAQ